MEVLRGNEFRLAKPLSLEKIHFVTRSMAKGKSLNLNEVVVEFYIFFSDLVRKDLFNTIMNATKVGHLPNRLIRDGSNVFSK
jgi:hypothetical protein